MADTIKRCSEHLSNFTLLDNTCLKTSTLSMQAMGLFAYLMTLPNDWQIYKSELVNHFSNGRDAVYKAFNELIDNGFITFEEMKNEKKQFIGNVYYIHERPVSEAERSKRKEHKTTSENNKNKNKTVNEDSVNGEPVTEKPFPGNPYTENPSLPSTNNTNDLLPSTNNQILSAESGKEKKNKKISFKTTDYQSVLNAYFINCELLFEKGLIKTKTPTLPSDTKKLYAMIKPAFKDYGVEAVMNAVDDSLHYDWLVKTGYNISDIFRTTTMMKLINKSYVNESFSKNQNKKYKKFDGSELPDFLGDIGAENA